MQQVVQDLRTGRTRLEEVPAPAVRPGGVVVRNLFSVISAGTERMVVESSGRGLLATARRRPELVRRTLDMARKRGLAATLEAITSRFDAPAVLGYSCAGRVVEIGEGVADLQVGDLVACGGAQHAHHAEFVAVPRQLCVRVPDSVSPLAASFATLGAIAVHGARVADVRLGEAVAVIGLGLVGQLVVQVLRAAGCRVFGIDLEEARVRLALALGAHAARTRGAADLLAACDDFTSGRGMDAVVVAADARSSDPLDLAGQVARDRAIVSVVGAVEMQLPRHVYYGKELQVRLSRSYGPGRYDPLYEEHGLDYPIGYVRWTEQRNMEAFLDLVAAGAVQPERLVTHRFPVQQAERAYALIAGERREPCLAVVLEYPLADAPPVRVIRVGAAREGDLAARRDGTPAERLGVGFVGAGNFARTVLLPAFRACDSARLVGVAAASGVSAQRAARRYGFELATTDYRELVREASVGALVVATRHHLHASIAREALGHGKAVWLEKPMAMDVEELGGLLQAWRESGAALFVGFNRRYAPLVREMRTFFSQRRGPLALVYRVNAGPLGPGSWVRDPLEGGGALLSEACHFVDLLHLLVGQACARVFASPLGRGRADTVESAVVQLEFPDGSVGTVTYTSGGDLSVPKERLEVIGDGAVAVLDDFARLHLTRGGRSRALGSRLGRQDKGHRAQVAAFVAAARSADASAYDTLGAALSTLATFRALESIQRGMPVELAPEALGL